MAAYTIAAGETGAYEKTLVASTTDTVTITGEMPNNDLELLNEGSVGIYFTLGGVTPTVGGAGMTYLPPNSVRTILIGSISGLVVTLISSGTPKYSVAKV